jgi:signal transduction histidine kinase
MFRSLRLRLAVSFAVVSLVILAVVTALVLLLLARGLDHRATDQLEAEASAQVQRIQEGGSLEPTADVDVPSASAIQIAVYPAGSSTAAGDPGEGPTWLIPYPSPVTDLRVAEEHVRVVTLPADVNGAQVAQVVVGRSLEPEEALVEQVRSSFLWASLVVLLAAALAGWWWAGRAVEPVERAYEAQAGFAADASHELRTPLAFIRAGVETLVEEDPTLGAEVLDEVDYLTALSQRLLQLARADHGGLALERLPVDLGSACRHAARRCTASSGTVLSLEGSEGVVARGDRVAVEATLDAVLENVTRHGGGRGEVRWAAEDGNAVVRIVDHGPGIPADLRDRAFERFFRVDPSRARGTGGAGLGLALARSLVEAQAGKMWLDPTRGGGVTATIVLPRDGSGSA